MGISEADWIRLAIALSLIAYAGKKFKEKDQESTGNSFRLAFMGFAASVALLAGLYINGYHLLDLTPKESVYLLIDAGYSQEQSREIYLEQAARNQQSISDSSALVRQILKYLTSSTDTLQTIEADETPVFPN